MTLAFRLAEQVERDWLTETLATLVRIPSVTGEEDAAQEWMAETLKDLGGDVDAWRVDAEALKGRPGFPGARILIPRQNVVVTFAGTDAGPTLVLNGHIDTVSAGDEARWTHPPFAATLVGDRLYGRGAADIHGNLRRPSPGRDTEASGW